MKDIGLKFFVNIDYLHTLGDVSIYIKAGDNVAKPVTLEMEPIKQTTTTYRAPTMCLSSEDAQRLLQALWDAGIRPNDGESSLAHVEAIKYHLEDVRKLLFLFSEASRPVIFSGEPGPTKITPVSESPLLKEHDPEYEDEDSCIFCHQRKIRVKEE